MTAIEIEYCVPCGLLDNATRVQRDLLEAFGQELGRVSLVTGDGGVFKVRVDGELVFDGQEARYDRADLLDEVRDRLELPEAEA